MSRLKDFFKDFLGSDVEEEIKNIDIKDNTLAIEQDFLKDENTEFKNKLRIHSNKKVNDVSDLNQDTLNKMREVNSKNSKKQDKEIAE